MIPDDVAKLVDWLPKKRYLQLTGETDAAVSKRIAQKVWKAREQYSRPEGGGIWISLKGVNAWAAQHKPEPPTAPGRTEDLAAE